MTKRKRSSGYSKRRRAENGFISGIDTCGEVGRLTERQNLRTRSKDKTGNEQAAEALSFGLRQRDLRNAGEPWMP